MRQRFVGSVRPTAVHRSRHPGAIGRKYWPPQKPNELETETSRRRTGTEFLSITHFDAFGVICTSLASPLNVFLTHWRFFHLADRVKKVLCQKRCPAATRLPLLYHYKVLISFDKRVKNNIDKVWSTSEWKGSLHFFIGKTKKQSIKMVGINFVPSAAMSEILPPSLHSDKEGFSSHLIRRPNSYVTYKRGSWAQNKRTNRVTHLFLLLYLPQKLRSAVGYYADRSSNV